MLLRQKPWHGRVGRAKALYALSIYPQGDNVLSSNVWTPQLIYFVIKFILYF